MQTIGGDRGSVWVEVHMHVEVVGGTVDEIDWGRGGFTLNGQYHTYSLDITCTCK